MFSVNHKDLVMEGEKRMKGTTTSCTVVGALIVTVMFAVAFQVPEGNNQETCYPIFVNEKLFKVFVCADIHYSQSGNNQSPYHYFLLQL